METKTNNKTFAEKMATHFGVKIAKGQNSVKAIDMDKRIVEFIGNTYFWIDSDLDMLVPGCAVKSINDRGPKSQANAKIKHQNDHRLDTRNTVGRFVDMEEKEIDGKFVLWAASYIPPTTKGNDDLINYQEGIFDNHSIGFRYKSIIWASKDSENELSVKAWEEFYPKALNPEVADENGGFWVVKEIELFEISVVSYGANQLTPVLGVKSKDRNQKIKSEIISRLNEIVQLKSSAETKADQKNIEMEALQLKQIITDLDLNEPSKKDTDQNSPSQINDTQDEGDTKSKSIINILTKSIKDEKAN